MRTPCLVLCLLASCSGGGGGTPIPSVNVPAELVVCRSERDSPGQGTLRTATRRGLADKRLADAAGVESDVRIHPDGIRIVFARERRGNDADSREIFTGTVDGSALERRLTTNDDRDDSPCWNSDGTKILFSSNRGGRRRIWSMALDGTDADPLFDDGSEQTDPDARGGLVVFSRWDLLDPTPRRTLWMFDEVALTAWPVTDGGVGTSSDVPGDKDPAFSPDGAVVLFTRSTSDDAHRLMKLTVASGIVEPVGGADGDDRWPRWSPHGDSIFVARSRPDAG
ncbi:MAG: PD40 domain-containing protein, partial [Planctomycetes bacterium]|nr:PD40 domain-containing protein [Planctomycetota bacterium]